MSIVLNKKTAYLKCFAVCALALTANLASAAVSLFNGDTTGGPTWNRPIAGIPPTTLSGVGTAVRYEVFEFRVNNDSKYNFAVNSSFDNYLFLYKTNFNPASQFANVIIGNDDFTSSTNAGFNDVSLSSALQYYLVVSGFDNADFGVFSGTISGLNPSDTANFNAVSAVPEPSEWALMLAGLGAVSWAAKRRKI
jgi:hypothetical protein